MALSHHLDVLRAEFSGVGATPAVSGAPGGAVARWI
jgi:hypothetical protein